MKKNATTRKQEKACPILDLIKELNLQAGVILFAPKSVRGRAGAIASFDKNQQAKLIAQRVGRIEVIQAACFSLQQGSADTSTKSETIAILYRLACGGDPEGVLPSASASCPGLCTRECTDFELHEVSMPGKAEPLSKGLGSNNPKTKKNGTPARSPRNGEEGFSYLPCFPAKRIPLQYRDEPTLPPSRKTPSNKPKSS